MCGITDHIYRTICYELGCDIAYTEMISAMGYLCAPQNRSTVELMRRGSGEPVLILQLFGKDPDTVAEAIRRIDESGHYDGYDLNMGCPAHKVASSGEGCGLMKTPQIAEQMMRKAVSATKKAVSVKMRLGWDENSMNVLDYAKMAEDSGISEVTIHGRTRTQQYSGEADWQMIQRVKASVSIPVIGNGDIFDAPTALQRMRESGTDGVMIGRGAMGNPWIFREIKALIAGQEPDSVTLQERYGMILRHYHDMLCHKPEAIAVREMRKHIAWYIHGLRGAGRTRAEINRMTDIREIFAYLQAYFTGLENRNETD